MTGTRARWAAMLGVAVAVSALLAATGWLAPPAAKQPTQAPRTCTILQAENVREGAPTTLRLLALPAGTTRRVTQAGYWINAMGYSAAQDVVYGVADGTRAGRYGHGAHAVRIDAAGVVTDLGVIGRAGAHHPVWSLVTGATAGAIDGGRWYVRQGSDLYTVDIDPAGQDYLRVVHRTPLRPVSLAVGVDDFAVDPADGLLYGVSTTSRGDSSVVAIDPVSGRVAVVPGLRFPAGGAYGAVVLAPGTIYATANQAGRRSVTYRLPRDGSGPAVEVASGPPLVSSDAAGCLAEAAPPSTTQPPPSTTQSPQPPPSTTPPSSPTRQPPVTQPPAPSAEPPPPSQGPPVEQPVAVPPAPVAAPPPAPVVTPTPSASAPPPPTPPPPSSPHVRPTQKAQFVASDSGKRTAEKRRWGLTALILVLGGGAAVGHGRRHR
ncbi:DUF6923 family protein [Amycolatopsis sp. cmx-4-61]|uniref:DUF6923 family protein n=1 Tax=Amycolatopsis sp. cmx-4-61 TaxID=2790937 RepID=UPI00397D6913